MRAALTLLAVVVVIMLGLLEFATRWMFDGIGTTADNTSYFARQWRAAEEGGRNSLGFREREVTTKADDVVRIAVIGDSFTYGQGIRLADRHTERLDAALGDAFEVFNFGRGGANYEEHLVNMAVALDAADPDIVILQWLFNDVQPAGERRPRPTHLAGPFHRFLQPYSAAYFMANRGFTQLQADLGLAPDDRAYFALFADPQSERGAAARARLEAVLDLPAAAGVPHGIVLWPPASRRFDGLDELFDPVLEVCADRAIPCLDLRPAIAALPDDVDLVVSRYDSHPNAVFNAAAAEAMLPWLDALLSNGPADEAAPADSSAVDPDTGQRPPAPR